jgi:predicted PurR-regulated permease PerM
MPERVLAPRLPSIEPGSGGPAAMADATVEALGVSLNVAELIGASVIVLALSVYWTASGSSFERRWLSLLPAGSRGAAAGIWLEIRTGVGEKIRQELTLTVLTVVAADLGFHLIGLDYPTIPAFACGCMRLVPLVGPGLAVIAAFAAGVSTSLVCGVAAGSFTVALLFVEETLVAPRLAGPQRANPFLVTLTILAIADAFGIVGLLVAPAVATAVQILAEGILASIGPTVKRAPPDLDERMGKLAKLLGDVAEPPPPELASIIDRLEKLVIEAEDAATSS